MFEPTMPQVAAHEDGRLMHELTVVNGQISRYVFRFLDADAGQAEPVSVDDERALSERLTTAAGALEARARRRETRNHPQIIDGDMRAEQA